MNTGGTPGDGKTSPFGDGRGGSGGAMANGNDFARNPGGNPSGPSRLPDLINNSRQQSPHKPGFNTSDAAPGGLIPNAAPPANRRGGVGTPGNGQKPFRVGGG